ncbi:MAG TPA: RidA family protein [Coxiellaceae bacterium]|nr:MAG: reactive intermediate/imine deaminase [Gammaproteobacteria bacterium RIFCSPHIGHO2_12_FULL_36_30]HLB56198.1 RidA family protein [Coxiellaceae bacterium]
MKKQIETSNAPAAIGTYSQAIKTGNTVYISGQIPLNPKTMKLMIADFPQQVKQVFENLKAIAIAAGGDLSHIVKLTVYLQDMNHFPIVNEMMETYFEKPYPARVTVEVSRLPKDVGVEMDAVMVVDV